MRKNLFKILGSALLLAVAAWQAHAAAPPGTISYKKWYRFGGNLNDLRNMAEFPNQPNEMRSLTSIEDPTPDNGDNEQYGTFFQGYVSPPVTGNYTFYITSDDNSELYLSTDNSPANKVRIANEPAWNGGRQYINGDNQGSRGNPAANISVPIALTAGQKYYIEVIMQEGGGGNNVSVAWDVPGEPTTVRGSLPIQGTNSYPVALGGLNWTNLYPYETTPSAVSRSYYANIGGGNVTDLTNNQNFAAYPYYPTAYTTLGKLEETTPDNGAFENFGARLQALLTPPVTGNYDFAISSDDGAALYISTDMNPNHKVLIATEPGWNGSRQFINGSNQGSRGNPAANLSTTLFPAGRNLVAGQKYYIEAIEKEGGGGNNLSVTWAAHGTAINDNDLPISTTSSVNGVPGGPFQNLYPLALTVTSAGDSPIANTMSVTFSVPVEDASSQNPANYTIVGGGLTVTAASLQGDKQSVSLTLSGALIAGTTYTVTANGVNDRLAGANPMAGPSSASFKARSSIMSALRYEYYDNIGGGTAVADLTGSSKYQARQADSYGEKPSLDTDAGRGDQYGAKMYGYIIPTASGNYSFELNSDDASLVLMSGSSDDGGKVQLVRMDGCCANFDTVTIPLIAGRAYAVEAYMKEGGGGDNLDLRWRGGDIGGTFVPLDPAHIAYSATPVKIVTQPIGVTALEGTNPSFSVGVIGDAPVTYQWYTNGVPVPGGTGPSLTLVYVTTHDEGKILTCIVGNYSYLGAPVGPYSDTSTPAILHVTGDSIKPTVTMAFAGPTYDQIRICFSESVGDVSSSGASLVQLTAANFQVLDPSLTPLTISSVAMNPDNSVATLTMQVPLLNFANPPASYFDPLTYTVDVHNVVDGSPSHNPLNPDPTDVSVRGLIVDPNNNLGKVLVERYENLQDFGWKMANLTNNANYPYYPTNLDTRNNFNIPQSNPNIENFGYRARAFLIATETANYQFRVGADDSAALFLSGNSDPAGKVQIAGADNAGCAACGYANSANNIHLVAGKIYYIEALSVEVGGGDWLNVQWKNNGAISGFQDIPSGNLALYIDPSKINLAISGLNDVSVNDCTVVNYTAKITDSGASYQLGLQWSVDGVPITDATNMSFSTPSLTAPGPHTVQLDASLIGKTVSAVSTVTITGQPVPPAIVSAKADGTLTKVVVTFNKPIQSGQVTADHFIIQDSGNNNIDVLSVDLDPTAKIVTIRTVSEMPDGATYSLTVDSQLDVCNHNMVPDPAVVFFKTPKILQGLVTFETYGNPSNAGGIGGNNVNQLVADPRYPNSPRTTRFIGALNSRLGYPDDSHEAYGGRMWGYFIPPTTDNYIFYTKGDDGQRIRMNSNPADSASPDGAVTIVDTGDACCQAFSAHGSANISLNGGQRYYIEALWKEGGGGDFQQVAYKLASDPANPDNLPFVSCAVLSTAVDADVLATRPDAPKVLPLAGKLALGSLNNRGFQVHFVQVATNINNTTADAERLLACQGGPNVAGVPSFVSQIMNYNINDGGNYGHIQPDPIFPGTPGRTGNNNNLALEALTYLELQPGIIYTFDVNSDDGFRVSPATSVGDANNAITLGEFSGGRGSSDSFFQLTVSEAGLYPIRLIWEQGGGGANLEFTAYDQCSGNYLAINDNAGIHAYLPTLPIDTDPPVIVTCPANRNLLITSGCSTTIPDLTGETFAADCRSGVTVSQSPAAGTVVNGVGPVTVTMQADDDSGNRATCLVTLTVLDKAPPIITACAPAASTPETGACAGVVPNMTAGVIASDACGGIVTVTQSPVAGSSAPTGPNTITFTATDTAGNFAICTSTLNVVPSGPTPTLHIAQSGPGYTLTWTSTTSCWKVQGSTSLTPASYVTIEGHSPVSVLNDSGMKFFRLIATPNP